MHRNEKEFFRDRIMLLWEYYQSNYGLFAMTKNLTKWATACVWPDFRILSSVTPSVYAKFGHLHPPPPYSKF